ncbi:MAG: glutaminase A [Verrucomicrobiales bacterium]
MSQRHSLISPLHCLALALLLGGCAPHSSPDLHSAPPLAPPQNPVTPSLSTDDLTSLEQEAKQVLQSLADNREGEVYSGAVEGTDPDDFAIAVALVDGRGFQVGSATTRFPIMSISKPFTLALALEQRGPDFIRDHVGVSATGFPYNDLAAGSVRRSTEQNPLVNAGAIATHSYIVGDSPADKSQAVVQIYSQMADADLAIQEEWRAIPRALTYALAYQMQAADRLEGDVDDVTNRYLEACIVEVGVSDLAQMGATLAANGIQPRSGQVVLSPETVREVLSVMTIAGMYEDSGTWWTKVGIPAKSGVSGAIVAVVPGWGSVVVYSPRLDPAGNSVRAALAIEELSTQWNLHSMTRLLLPGEPREDPELLR